MKLLLYADNHFSKYSSILRSRGGKYSKRLENQIQSLNWVEEFAKEQGCDAIVCLGDFFDKPTLDAEEISALKEIKWNKDMRRVFLVGNHELGIRMQDEYNSANLFSLIENSEVINKPMAMLDGDTLILLLPYLLEVNDDTLHKIIPQWITDKEKDLFKRIIILSHNDLKGVQYGGYISKSGLNLNEIDECCDLFINGHIHNGDWINKKVLNLGNLTGQNFSESDSIYNHCVCILDTNTLDTQCIMNPYGIYFKKLEYYDYLNKRTCNHPMVLSISCKENELESAKNYCESHSYIMDYRIIVEREQKEVKTEKVETLNHQ